MEPSALARDINQTCRLHGGFRLRSGQLATEYFDKYLFESQPDLLRRVAEAIVPLLPDGTELLGGLELGGVPIATMVSSLTGLPALFVRKQSKTHGTCRLAEGADVRGRRVTLIEDVITTGGAVRNATMSLRRHHNVVGPDKGRPRQQRHRFLAERRLDRQLTSGCEAARERPGTHSR